MRGLTRGSDPGSDPRYTCHMSDRDFLRHTLATLAYRAAKAVRGAPPTFATMTPSAGSRTPAQILAHMGDLFDWALSLARGQRTWKNSTPLPWDAEVARFFDALGRSTRISRAMSRSTPRAWSCFRGQSRTAFTHTGQLTMLRRVAGSPIKGENYAQGRHRRRPRDRLTVGATPRIRLN